MPVLSNQPVSPATQAANQVLFIVQQSFAALGRSGLQGYNLIWKNRNATPQEVLSALGTNAAAIFQLAQLNITTVNSAATIGGTTPPMIPSIPDGYTLTFNSDGSATATYIDSDSSSSSSSGH